MFKYFVSTYLFLITVLDYCNGCLSITGNASTVDNTLLDSLLQPIKNSITVFNSSSVPDLESFIEKFNAGTSNEDIHLNITQLLTKYGYRVETHTVQTSDGYLLDIFRIPSNGTSIVVMHGLLCSSDDFVSTGPDHGLAYLLADLKYDVWLGNARGTLHGRKHINKSPECADFWDFSWDEIGRYDLPAIIDYILNVTNQSQLPFIGHSQGVTSYLVMTSELPEYNDKISVAIALSAVSYLKYSTDPLFNLLAPFSNTIGLITQALGLYEFLPRNQITDAFTTIACGTPLTASVLCNNILFLLYGFDYAQVNATVLPVIYGHYPGGCAAKQLVHYGQNIKTGKFAQFDYGSTKNFIKYKSLIPPQYNVSKVTSKIALFYADNDYLFTTPDRKRLTSELPNVIESYRVQFKAFTHMDFLFAKDVRSLVYNEVVQLLNKYV